MNRVNQRLEQLRDIYCGRHTYDSLDEWLDNVDAAMKEVCDEIGLDFVAPIREK